MAAKKLSLRQVLLADKIIDEATLKNLEIRAHQLGKPLEQVLVDSQVLPKTKFLRLLSRRWEVKAVDLASLEIDEEAATLIPETTARRYLVLPFARAEKLLYTAMARPWDLTAIEDLSIRTNYKIHPYLSLPSDISNMLDQIFTQDSKITDYISNITSESKSKLETEKKKDSDREEITIEKPDEDDERQARRIVNAIILEGVKTGASDIHVEPFENKMLVRYRVDGQLVKSSFNISKNILNAVMARIKIMSKTMDITERRLPQDGRLLVTFEKRPIEFRVNTIPTEYGESCVMRILDRSSIMVELQKLGFDEKIGEKFRSALKKPYGIILVSGPTGSGKSTTLYSSLNYLLKESKKNPDGKTKNVSPKKILTAENPVEYNLDEIIQLNIKPDIGLTFAAAMRAFLRQDPDIIMVGEVRDRETAQIAMEAALTGHLVLSTIHTNDAPSAVSRLAEMRVPTYLISSTVEAVLAQRLVRKICPDCAKDMHRIPEKLLAEFEKHNIPREKVNLKVGEGCKECSNTGYKGRMGIYELLELDEDIRELLLEQIAASPIAKLAEKKGMRRLWEDGLIKVARGLTTYEEILRVSQ